MTFTKSSVTEVLANSLNPASIYSFEQVEPNFKARVQRSLIPNSSPVNDIVYPQTQLELAQVMNLAAQYQWRVLPCGRGSKLDWGGLADSIDLVISTAQIKNLIEHAVGDLTVTVEAGMPLAELQAILAKAGQFLAIDPAYPDTATIGGIVATANTGSLRHRYGGIRDMLLGITFVRSDGKLVKAGGRVVKNVAGYDLMKLLTGSFGSLGIITQVTFRLYPLPEASQTIVLTGKPDAIASAQAQLLSSALTPVVVDLVSHSVVSQLHLGTELGLIVRFDGLKASVDLQSHRLLELGQNLNLKGVTLTTADHLEQQLQKLFWQSSTLEPVICKFGVLPTQAVATITAIEKLQSGSNFYTQIHAGSGLGILKFQDISVDSLLKIRALIQASGGFLSVLEAPVALKQQLDVWGYIGNALPIMQQLKQKFDPQNLLSPHRFI